MKRMKTLVSLLLVVVMCFTTFMLVQAEMWTDENGDTWEAPVYYREDFEYEGSKPDYLVGANIATGVHNALPNIATVTGVDAGENNKAMSLQTADGVTSAYQVNLRWSTADAWNESKCTSDLTGKTVVYEFKFKLNGESNGISARLRSYNGTTNKGDIVLFTIGNNSGQSQNNTLGFITDATTQTLTAGASAPWYNIKVVCDFENKTQDVYLDGTLLVDDIAMHNAANINPAEVCDFLRFNTGGGYGLNADILIDDFAVYEEPIKVFAKENFEFEGETPDYLVGANIATGVHNALPNIATVTGVDAGENNKAMSLQTADGVTSAYQVNLRWSTADAWNESKCTSDLTGKTVVYEFKFKLNGESNGISARLRSYNGTTNKGDIVLFTIGNNSGLSQNNTLGFITDATTQTLTAGAEAPWYSLQVVCDFENKTQDVYLDGTLLVDDIAMHNAANINPAGVCDFLRFNTGGGYGLDADILVDDFAVYESTVPVALSFVEETEEEDTKIVIDPNKSTFEDVEKNWTKQFPAMLEGYMSLHTRNGMVYYNDATNDGKWTLLATKPVETEDGFLVVAEEICAALNVTCTINGNAAEINGKQATVVSKDGKLWINAEYFFETILGKVVSIDTEAKTDGMMIAGDTAFTWPTAVFAPGVSSIRTELQNLNDYLFFERPSAEKIETLFEEKNLSGVHPRVQATAEDFARIKEEVKTSATMKAWYDQLIVLADDLVNRDTAPTDYTLNSGGSLLPTVQTMLEKMYVLGMAYQLTGDEKYADRAWADLESVSAFPNWQPGLPTVEMSAAVAIGYDWMYHAFDDEQRATIEEAMYKLCFPEAVSAYQEYTPQGGLGAQVACSMNQNIVCNGGFAMGALAFMDVNEEYMDICSYILSGAIHGADIMLTEYGPDGAWKEGTGYWYYTTQYTAKMLSTLETAFGTCFSLDLVEGVDMTADFILRLQSDVGLFPYGDGGAEKYYKPEMFYLSNKYDSSITSAMLEICHGNISGSEEIVLSLLWFDTDAEEAPVDMTLDGIYWGEGVAAFRDKWSDGVTAFVAIHGGTTWVPHSQLDAGTFVFDYAGIRWAKDLGKTPYYVRDDKGNGISFNYDVENYPKRWTLYRSKAEAHNTLVINPENGKLDQVVDATAYMIHAETGAKGAIAVLDMTENYAQDANSAIRGFFFTDDRSSLVVRDEITLKEADSTVYWFMQTDADVVIAEDGKSATLTQAGKQVILTFVTEGNGTAELSVGPSTRELLGTVSPVPTPDPLPSDINNYDKEDADVNRIYIKVSGASEAVSITVKLTPAGTERSSVADYNKSIATWSVPEGEVAEKPVAQGVTIDGREVEFESNNTATLYRVHGSGDPTVKVTVDETKYTYEVAADAESGLIKIRVKDKNNADIYTEYLIDAVEIPAAKVPDEERFSDMIALQVVDVFASDSPQANLGYIPVKVLDQNTEKASAWTSKGEGNWIMFKLEEESAVDNLLIYYSTPNTTVRDSYFDVWTSTDGVNFEEVLSNQTQVSHTWGQFSLGGKTAKYIKIVCNGNSTQGGGPLCWNYITEVVFTGKPTASLEIVEDKTDVTYKLGTNGTVEVYCTGLLNTFVEVLMDGTVVDAANYTLTEGSTILTFKAAYLETLSEGAHTVKLLYTGERSDEFTLTVEKAEESTEASTEESTEASTEESTEASTEESTETSTEESTEASTEESTEASTEESTEASTEESTEVSNVESTEASAEESTETSTGAGLEGEADPDTGDKSSFVWVLALTLSGLCLAAIPTMMKKENEA